MPFQEYIPLIKLILIPLGFVLSCAIFQKWIRLIADLIMKIEAMVLAFNKASFLILLLYYVVLAYIKLT